MDDTPQKKDVESPEEREKRWQLLMLEREEKFKHTSHWTGYVILGICILLSLLFASGFLYRNYKNRQFENVELSQATALVKVSLLTVHAVDTPVSLTLPSSLQAMHITPLWARVNGYIKSFLVDIGDRVNKGDVLAVIETPELDQEYEQAVGNLTKAKSEQKIAKITAERWKGLYESDAEAVSKQDVDQKIADMEMSQAQVVASEANVNRLQQMLDFKLIRAPFNGVIIERNIDIGTLISGGVTNKPQQLYVIAETDIMRVFVNVPQRFYRMITEGLHCDVIINEFPNRIFDGIVARFAKALDPVARTLLTEIHIPNSNYELYAGLFANVTFKLKPNEKYFIIPTSALIIRSDGPKVAVLMGNDIIHIKDVKLGIDHGKYMEIISGLNENDRLILNISDKIVEGAKAEVVR